MHPTDATQRGTVLIPLLLVMITLFGLAGIASSLTNRSLQTARSSIDRTRAFYVADSGVQIGSFLVRSTSGAIGTTQFTETIGGGTADVTITQASATLFEVTSLGSYAGQTYTVVEYLEVVGGFRLSAAVELAVGEGVELEGALGFDLGSVSKISGFDHDASGNLLADQSQATHGIAVNEFPGGSGIVSSGTGTVEGAPTPTQYGVEDQRGALNDIRKYARDNADLNLAGSNVFGTAATGTFGTPGSPVTVYADLNEEETLTFSGDFEGYGTLVVRVDEAEVEGAGTAILQMMDNAKWHGLVLMRFSDEVEVEDVGGAIVDMSGTSSIIGGLVMHFTGEEIELDDGGLVMRTDGSAQVLLSRTLVASAPGVSSINSSVRMLSYFIQ